MMPPRSFHKPLGASASPLLLLTNNKGGTEMKKISLISIFSQFICKHSRNSVISKVIALLPAIMICLQFTPALCADFTGNWSGTWRSDYGDSGGVSAIITQTGTSLTGKLSITNTGCGNFSNLSLTGSVSDDAANFQCAATCPLDGSYNELYYTHGTISGNTMTGDYTVYSDGYYYDSGIFSMTRPETPRPFSDVPAGYWAEDYINAIYYAEITTGCAQDDPGTPQNERRYCPEDNVSREQMAAFIVRAVEGEPPANYCDSGVPFPDVSPSTWSCKYIKKLYELGITTGYGDGTYGSFDLVPREQMATFIVRAVEGEPPEDYCASGVPFPDVASDMWSCDYIKRLKELNITTGYGDGTYGPYDLVTRAQMAAFLARAFLGMP